MKTGDIPNAELGEIGRWIAGRTGEARYAAIARSCAPQGRFDAEMTAITKDPTTLRQFTLRELRAITQRIENLARRAAATALVDVVQAERCAAMLTGEPPPGEVVADA